MAFFDNFKLVKQKSGIVVKYKTSTFITIKPAILTDVVLDHLPKKVIQEAASRIVPSSKMTKNNTLAVKLMVAYNRKRKDFYKRPRLKDFTSKSKEFKYFVQAAELLKIHRVLPDAFIEAQVKGLSFVNNGEGVFPKPQQLATTEAEERLLRETHTESKKNNPEDVQRLDLKPSDRETELMQNPRFVSRYEKMKDKSATLQDAYFVQDCMLERKGRVTQFVSEYIEDLLNE